MPFSMISAADYPVSVILAVSTGMHRHCVRPNFGRANHWTLIISSVGTIHGCIRILFTRFVSQYYSLQESRSCNILTGFFLMSHKTTQVIQSLKSIKCLVYLYRRVCVCLCVYPSDGIHVVACGPIGTKFGTHVQIHLQMVVS